MSSKRLSKGALAVPMAFAFKDHGTFLGRLYSSSAAFVSICLTSLRPWGLPLEFRINPHPYSSPITLELLTRTLNVSHVALTLKPSFDI